MGRVRMPDGKRIAVNLGADFDAQAIWLGSFNMPIQSLMHRGQFGAEVGLPRLLEVWERYSRHDLGVGSGARGRHLPRDHASRGRCRARGRIPRVLPREPDEDLP
jgi:hypothetical protein